MADATEILLIRLGEGHPALTPAAGLALAEAAAVCLEERGHSIRTSLGVAGEFSRIFTVVRTEVNEQQRLCYNDPEEATEFGACGIAILVLLELTGLHVIERSRKDTGFDYWLGTQDVAPFQNKTRLEVSGIRTGDVSTIQTRVRRKIRQIQRSGADYPAYIVVVEFSRPLVQVVRR